MYTNDYGKIQQVRDKISQGVIRETENIVAFSIRIQGLFSHSNFFLPMGQESICSQVKVTVQLVVCFGLVWLIWSSVSFVVSVLILFCFVFVTMAIKKMSATFPRAGLVENESGKQRVQRCFLNYN